ncbi:hypothetical protein ACQUWY_27215, partial [Ralstonia pseudosolanacearum]
LDRAGHDLFAALEIIVQDLLALGITEPLVPLAPTLAALQALPGIGEWTAQYIAMRALGWPNAFPLGDYVLRKRLADHDGTLPTRHAMATRAEDWAPWRAYAAMHLWHRDDALAPTP